VSRDVESPGHGALRFVRSGARTVVHTARAKSPLRLLLPNNHGDGAWVYVASLGGGLVDGDALSLSVDVDEGACALLGTQASTKVYRSPHGTSMRLDARVGAAAMLAVVPDPVSCFRGARYEQHVDVALAGDTATLVLVDTLASGRAARGERWAFERFASRTRVSVGGRAIVHDSLQLDPAHGDLVERMGRFEALATIVAAGPRAAGVIAQMHAAAAAPPERDAPCLHAVTALSPAASIGRLAATSAQEAVAAVRALLAPLAVELGNNPFTRRW
jgi:urease accessory protein